MLADSQHIHSQTRCGHFFWHWIKDIGTIIQKIARQGIHGAFRFFFLRAAFISPCLKSSKVSKLRDEAQEQMGNGTANATDDEDDEL